MAKIKYRQTNRAYCGNECDYVGATFDYYGNLRNACTMFNRILKVRGGYLLRCADCRKLPKKKCVGCGWCCSVALCAHAKKRGVKELPCKFLISRGKRHWCKLVCLDKVKGKDLAIGVGCWHQLNDVISRIRNRWIKNQKGKA